MYTMHFMFLGILKTTHEHTDSRIKYVARDGF